MLWFQKDGEMVTGIVIVVFITMLLECKKIMLKDMTQLIRDFYNLFHEKLTIIKQAQKEAPLEMQCRDKFLLQSAVASPGTTPKDITPELFKKDSGNQVEECKLKVNYVAPRQPPTPVRERSEDGFPRGSISENGTVNTIEYNAVPRSFAEANDNSSETFVKDGEVQCVEGDPSRFFWWWKEGVYWILNVLLCLLDYVIDFKKISGVLLF